MIGLVNYDGGNYKSVSNILEYLNINFLEVKHNQDLKKVSHIMLRVPLLSCLHYFEYSCSWEKV